MSAVAAPAPRLVDHFESGLDAPICLTWELTYACNLACVHCLSSSGPPRPARAVDRRVHGGRRRAPADAGLLREHRRRRADRPAGLLGARRLRHRARRRREVLHQRLADHARGRRPAGRRATTSTCRSRSTARRPRSTTPSAASGSYATAIAGDGAPERRRLRGLQALGRRHARRTSAQLDAFKAIADRYGAQLRLTRLRPSGRGADVWDELHPTAAQQRQLYDWLLAHGEEVLTGDSFFHLAAVRRSAARPEPLRRRPRRVPDRPGRRRLRLPVRDPRRVPGRQRPRARAASRRCGASRSCSRSCAGRRRAAPCLSLLALRRLPRRLHGGEVLHRAAARRPGPGVRARPRRVAARPARRRASVPRPAGRPLAPQAVASRPGAATRARSPGCEVARSRRALMAGRLVRDGRRGAAAGEAPPAAVRLQGDLRRRGARPDAQGQRRRVRRARLRAARRRAVGASATCRPR